MRHSLAALKWRSHTFNIIPYRRTARHANPKQQSTSGPRRVMTSCRAPRTRKNSQSKMSRTQRPTRGSRRSCEPGLMTKRQIYSCKRSYWPSSLCLEFKESGFFDWVLCKPTAWQSRSNMCPCYLYLSYYIIISLYHYYNRRV